MRYLAGILVSMVMAAGILVYPAAAPQQQETTPPQPSPTSGEGELEARLLAIEGTNAAQSTQIAGLMRLHTPTFGPSPTLHELFETATEIKQTLTPPPTWTRTPTRTTSPLITLTPSPALSIEAPPTCAGTCTVGEIMTQVAFYNTPSKTPPTQSVSPSPTFALPTITPEESTGLTQIPSSVTPASTILPTVQATPLPPDSSIGTYRATTNLNVRPTPGTGVAAVGLLTKGKSVSLLCFGDPIAAGVQKNGYEWCQIMSDPHRGGWVAKAFVERVQ